MRITVSLDTQAVITQPSPARAKAGGFVPVEIAFTRGSLSVMLPAGSTLEFVLKPKNTWTGGILVYHATFAAAAGSLYVGTANFATAELLSALGLTDNAPANDVSQIEAAAEIVWNIEGQRFRSSTFSVVVEAPLLDTTIIPPADPTLYPTPAELQALFDAKAEASHRHQLADIDNLASELSEKADISWVGPTLNAHQSAIDGKANIAHGHGIEEVTGLQTALNAKANASSLGNYVQRTPAAANFRFKDGTTLQLWNETTSKWHTVFLTGSDGSAQLTFSSSGEA